MSFRWQIEAQRRNIYFLPKRTRSTFADLYWSKLSGKSHRRRWRRDPRGNWCLNKFIIEIAIGDEDWIVAKIEALHRLLWKERRFENYYPQLIVFLCGGGVVMRRRKFNSDCCGFCCDSIEPLKECLYNNTRTQPGQRWLWRDGVTLFFCSTNERSLGVGFELKWSSRGSKMAWSEIIQRVV